MNPEQPIVPQPEPLPTNPKKMRGRTKLALWLMIGPTVLLIATFALFAIINFTTAQTLSTTTTEQTSLQDGVSSADTTPESLFDDDAEPQNLFGEQSTAQTIGNVLLFIAGAVGVATWLPGMIAGIILLATRK